MSVRVGHDREPGKTDESIEMTLGGKLAYNPKLSLISRVSGVHIGATLGIRWTDLYGADAACLHRPLLILLSRGGLYALLFAILTNCLSVHLPSVL